MIMNIGCDKFATFKWFNKKFLHVILAVCLFPWEITFERFISFFFFFFFLFFIIKLWQLLSLHLNSKCICSMLEPLSIPILFGLYCMEISFPCCQSQNRSFFSLDIYFFWYFSLDVVNLFVPLCGSNLTNPWWKYPCSWISLHFLQLFRSFYYVFGSVEFLQLLCLTYTIQTIVFSYIFNLHVILIAEISSTNNSDYYGVTCRKYFWFNFFSSNLS